MRDTKEQIWELLDAGEQVLRLREMFIQSPSFSALLQGPDHRFVLTNPAYQQLIGHRNVIGMLVICRASSTPGTRDWPFFVAWPQPLLFLGGWGQPPPASSAAAPTNTPHFLAVAFNRRPAPPCVSTMSPATSSTRPNTRRPARPRHHRGPMDQRHQGRRPKAAKERHRGSRAPGGSAGDMGN